MRNSRRSIFTDIRQTCARGQPNGKDAGDEMETGYYAAAAGMARVGQP